MTAKTDATVPAEGMALLVFLSLAWGVNWPVMKIGLTEVEPLTFRTLGILAGAAGLMAIARIQGRSLAVPRSDLPPLVLAALLNVTGWQLFSGYAISMMGAGRAAIIGFTMPLWAVILGAVFLKERIDGLRLGGLALGLCGLAVLLAPDVANLARAPWGVLLMLASAFSWGAGTVIQKAVPWRLGAIQLAAWQLLIGGLAPLAGMLVAGSPSTLLTASGTAWIAIAYVCVVAMMLCNWTWFRIVEIFPPGIAAIGSLAVPVVGVFSGALMLGERIGVSEIASLALVVAGLFLVLVVPAIGRRLPRRATAQREAG
ncbi:DMT family transporter [Arenibaculum pallidiluteum]|uniref:DMT family transporter n=1 Tax=Arenibaculum pallidiluteum TaxID=2812559 RepID=UPI001A95CFE4|nr:DMT family transporter [Arenibaculum pallidiluteum]